MAQKKTKKTRRDVYRAPAPRNPAKNRSKASGANPAHADASTAGDRQRASGARSSGALRPKRSIINSATAQWAGVGLVIAAIVGATVGVSIWRAIDGGGDGVTTTTGWDPRPATTPSTTMDG